MATFKRFKKSFKIRALIKAIKSEFHIFGGKRVAAMEFDSLSQIKAHGQFIHALPFFCQAGFKMHILGIAYQGIKDPV